MTTGHQGGGRTLGPSSLRRRRQKANTAVAPTDPTGANTGVAKNTPTGGVPHAPGKKRQTVQIAIQIEGRYQGTSRELPHTGSDLKSYLRHLPGGVRLGARARIWAHQPEVRGPLRLYDCPRPGELIILHPPEFSMARTLGQKRVLDSEVQATLTRTAREAAQGRGRGASDDDLVSRATTGILSKR